jgi:hypothetical protein
MTSKRYNEAEKIRALTTLESNKGDLAKTSRDTGIPFATLVRWEKERQASGESLQERLERVSHEVLKVMPEKMRQADFLQLARGLVILFDMMERTAAREGKRSTRSEVHEKLTRLIDQYAAENGTDAPDERVVGE